MSIGVLLAGTLALAACGQSASGGADGQETNGQEEVTFTWTFSEEVTGQSPYEELGELYMDENPHVTIQFEPVPLTNYAQVLRTQLQGGTAADLILTAAGSGQLQSVIPLAEAGHLEPLTAETSLATINDASRSYYEYDGAVYAQPVSMVINSVVYNKTAADAAGITYPESFEELLTACEDAVDAGVDSFLVLPGGTTQGPPLKVLALSAGLVYDKIPDWNDRRAAGEVTFAGSEEWRAVFEAYLAMRDAGCFQPGYEGAGFDVLPQGVPTGKSIANNGPSYLASEFSGLSDDEIRVRLWPAGDDVDLAFLMTQNTVSINADSPVKEAVADFVAWLAEPDNALRFAESEGTLPVVGGEDAELPVQYEEIQDDLGRVQFSPSPNGQWPSPAVYESLGPSVQGLLLDRLTVDDVLQNLDEAWDS